MLRLSSSVTILWSSWNKSIFDGKWPVRVHHPRLCNSSYANYSIIQRAWRGDAYRPTEIALSHAFIHILRVCSNNPNWSGHHLYTLSRPSKGLFGRASLRSSLHHPLAIRAPRLLQAAPRADSNCFARCSVQLWPAILADWKVYYRIRSSSRVWHWDCSRRSQHRLWPSPNYYGRKRHLWRLSGNGGSCVGIFEGCKLLVRPSPAHVLQWRKKWSQWLHVLTLSLNGNAAVSGQRTSCLPITLVMVAKDQIEWGNWMRKLNEKMFLGCRLEYN